MEIEIISFGRIRELIENQSINIEALENTDQVKDYLEQRYPALAGTKYNLALNKKLVQGKSEITGHSTIAIMPPFSGG
jgi:molybdopterin synthase sulfur carrier subunit